MMYQQRGTGVPSPWLVALACLLALQAPLAAQEPVNPKASAKTRELLHLLYELPSRSEKKVLSGQSLHVFNGGGWKFLHAGGDVNARIDDRVTAIFTMTGKWVAIMGAEYSDWWPKSQNLLAWQVMGQYPLPNGDTLNQALIRHATRGGIVELHYHPRSPKTGDWWGPDRGGAAVTAEEVLQPGPVHDNWMQHLEAAAAGLRELREHGVIVLWRPMHARDSGWWWGYPNMSRDDYRRIWAHMVDYFSHTWGLDNILYVQSWYFCDYKGFGPNHPLYAGNDLVDLVAVDHGADHVRPVDLAQEYTNLLSFGKPFGISQGQVDDEWARTHDYDMRKQINHIRQTWPRCTFIIQFDHDHDQAEADTFRYDLAGNRYAREFLSDPWIINAGEIFSGGAPPETNRQRPR
jgi:mannan endo-1,4-beta-mannosidase